MSFPNSVHVYVSKKSGIIQEVREPLSDASELVGLTSIQLAINFVQ